MKDDADAEDGGQGEGAHEAEGMEEGEDAEEAVASAEVEDLFELFDVGDEVGVGEHDAFGVAGAAAGKDDGGEVVDGDFFGLGVGGIGEEVFERGGGGEFGGEPGGDFFAGAGILDEVFEVNNISGQFQFNFFEEEARGDNGLEGALLDAGGEGGFGEGVVEVDGDFAAEEGGVIDERAGDAGGQEDADHFLAAPVMAQATGEEDGFEEDGAEGDFFVLRIGEGEAAWVLAGGGDQGAVEGF